MGLDHSEATVTITFEGLFVFCFKRHSDQRIEHCEVGVLNHHHHHLSAEIYKLRGGGTRERILRDFVLDSDILIAANSHPSEVKQYLAGGGKADEAEDFRWLADLEGEDFHKKKLTMKKSGHGEHTPATLRPKLIISDGTFYTKMKSLVGFIRERKDGTGTHEPPVSLGKLADTVAVDIRCAEVEGSAVTLTKMLPGGTPARVEKLNKEVGCRYEINIKNMRDPATAEPHHGSDFLIYYDVVEDPEGVRFDLDDDLKALFGGYPFKCIPTTLSRTTSLTD